MSGKPTRARLSLSCALFSAALLAGAPAASAALACGDVIESDAVLTRNLHCAGDGLVLAPPESPGQAPVTLDLGGHSVVGDGTGTGIRILGQFSEPWGRVTGGTVRGFEIGIDGEVAIVEDVRVTRSGTGVQLERFEMRDTRLDRNHQAGRLRTSGVPIERLHVWDNDLGIYIISQGSLIAGFRESRFGRTRDCAITGRDESVLVIEDSLFMDNECGIGGLEAMSYAEVRENRFLRNGTAVRMLRGTYPWGVRRIVDNVFTGNDLGVHLEVNQIYSGTTIEGNRFLRNRASGVLASFDSVEPLYMTDNVFMGNGHDPGDYVDADGAPADDGLTLTSTGTTELHVTGNRFLRNADLGAQVQGNVVEDADNVARRNGDPQECVGITCSAH